MKVFKQTGEGTCGPRSLQTALSHFNYFPSYKKIKKLCKTDRFGTFLKDMESAAISLGADVSVHRETACENFIRWFLDRNCPVIVNWTVEENVWHSAVVFKCDKSHLYLYDTSIYFFVVPEIKIVKGNLDKCWSKYPDSQWMMAIKDVKKYDRNT